MITPRLALTASLVLSLLSPMPSFAQDTAEATRGVTEIFSELESARASDLWDRVAELEGLGSAALPDIAAGLEAAPGVRLGASKALLSMEGGEIYRAQSLRALRDLLLAEDQSRALRIMSADLYMTHAGKSDKRAMRKSVDKITDPFVKISVLKGLRSAGRRALKAFLESDDLGLRAASALALAEMGNVTAAKPELERIKDEPTERGRRARLLLDQERMLARLEKYGALEKTEAIVKLQADKVRQLEVKLKETRDKLAAAAEGAEAEGGEGAPASSRASLALLDEILERVEMLYVDGEKIDEKALVDAAAKGLMSSLDPFSSYMTENETKEFQESIRQSYAGIGAVVRMDPESQYLMIVRPIYNGPCYKAGIRSMDKIESVEGRSTKGKTVAELVKELKGKPGTEVSIMVRSFLDTSGEAKPMTIVRNFVSLPSVTYDLLPGSLGYIELSQFGYKASEEMQAALADLTRRGMKGLILDLRGNPGGLLRAAVQIAGTFIEKNKLIVYQKGREGTRVGRRKEFRAEGDSKHRGFPMVVLINEGSASASEIVSGALKVHKRATVIGQRSFGKGSVQQLYKMRATNGQSNLRITIAYYYLPDDTCIHRDRTTETWRFRETLNAEIRRWNQDGLINETQAEKLKDIYKPTPGGVEPDIFSKIEELPRETRLKLVELESGDALKDYIRTQFPTQRPLFHKLVSDDREDTGSYPGFDALLAKAPEGLAADDLRYYLRATLRRFVQDDLGRRLPRDIQRDAQLERAIYELFAKSDRDIATQPEYARLAKRCADRIAAQREAAEKSESDKVAKKAKGEGESPESKPTPKPEAPKKEDF